MTDSTKSVYSSRRMGGIAASCWKSVAALAIILVALQNAVEAQLRVDYYNSTCEEVERIVKETMEAKFRAAPTSAAGTLRLFFHDCFVNGCDGSVLLASTDDNQAERDADVNLSLAGDGFDAVVKAKEAVEKACPGVVSCADLLAIATRDLIGLVGGPFYQVQQGRRDSQVSRATDATQQLPGAEDSVERLTEMFVAKGLSQQDLVALSGGHTIGFVHCAQFLDRIYNFQPDLQADPTLDPAFAAHLRESCPRKNLDSRVVVDFDVETPNTFDNAYYKNLMQGKGVISSDQRLFTDPHTRAQVTLYARSTSRFTQDFVAAIQKLGTLRVLTGSDGEIRQDCSLVNSHPSEPSVPSRKEDR